MAGQHNIWFSQFCPHWFFQFLCKLRETLDPFSTMNSKRTCWQLSKCQIRKTEHCSSVHVFCSLLVVRQIVGDPKNNEMSRAQFRASYMMLLVTRNATNRRNSAILQHFGYYVFKNKTHWYNDSNSWQNEQYRIQRVGFWQEKGIIIV